MSLSKKSRYVPPHLRENKKDIVIINPDDEMGPPPNANPQHVQQAAPYHAPNVMNHAPNINANASGNPLHATSPNLVHHHPSPQHHAHSSPYSSSQASSRRSYRNGPSSKPKSRPLSSENNNWRKATPTKQPQLNPQDLLPPMQPIEASHNHVVPPQNVQENSNPNVSNSNSMEMDHNQHHIPQNNVHYQNKARRYDSRRVNRGRGANRGRGGGFYPNNNHNPPAPYRQYNNYAAPVIDDDDPNEIQFAKIDAEENGNNVEAQAVHNPYGESPFVYAEEIEDEYHKKTAAQHQPAPQYKVKYVKKEEAQRGGNRNKRESRYNRQYNTPKNDAAAVHHVDHVVNDDGGGTDCNQYELSSNFQTLTTKNRQQRRRRNHRQNGPNKSNCNTNGNMNNNKSPKHKSSGSPKQKMSPNHNGKKKQNQQRSPAAAAANSNNAVQLSVGNKKKKAPPINWAQQLKPKQKQKQKAKPVQNAPTFIPHHALDSSQPICSDGAKVRHVLEVKNMKQSDYQKVSSVFRYFSIDFAALLSVNKRWFVVFDHHKTAVNALNIVKHNQFKLRRIDTNISDVEMLKNSVPPPVY